MPLHLLGKKSWNVYNHDNIDRVRKDEAEAQAREEAAEQRMQEEDATRRIALLRGETVPALSSIQQFEADEQRQATSRRTGDETYATRDRKRKRRYGEDDTDRDIRYAQQDRKAELEARQTLRVEQAKKGGNSEVPLVDHAGHIQLCAAPDEKAARTRRKNEEAEAEKAKKRKREEDLVTMKFSNAAGYNQGMEKPWYAASRGDNGHEGKTSASRNETMLAQLRAKDVWGNEDPRRKEREAKRIAGTDPFAAMQNAQRQLKQSEQDKEAWRKRQRIETEELARQQSNSSRRLHEDELDGFSLDAPSAGDESSGKHRHRRHHRRHRSRERKGEGRYRQHRHGHRSRDEEGRNRSRDYERHGSHGHGHGVKRDT